MKTKQHIPNPAGWDKPWPFADQVELWRIPTEYRADALARELYRERSDEGGEPFLSWYCEDTSPAFVKIHCGFFINRMSWLLGPILDERNGWDTAKPPKDFKTLHLAISEQYSKRQLVTAFEEHLDQLEANAQITFAKPLRGKKASDAAAMLESLALLRLQRESLKIEPFRKYWEWLQGTPFQFWTDQLADEAESKAERIERIATQAGEKIRHLERRMQTG